MPAFYIALRGKTKNEKELTIYRAKAPASVVNHEFKLLSQYGKTRVTCGEDPGLVGIMEFPTFAAAEAWYDSPLYQDAVKHLYEGAEMQCFILEGVEPQQ